MIDISTALHFLIFAIIIAVSISLDAIAFRRTGPRSFQQSLLTSLAWIGLALLFNTWIFFSSGEEKALEFFTGYIIEKALSIDNLFVFIMIFKEFRTPTELCHKALFVGIVSTIFLRLLLIMAGLKILSYFSWMSYVFGLFLIAAGIKAYTLHNDAATRRSTLQRILHTYIPSTPIFHGSNLFIKSPSGQRLATPLFFSFCAIEVADLVFALDSIPAILSITQDVYIVFTSNIFAILGLRSLYFVLEPLMNSLGLVQYAVGTILAFVGMKFLVSPFYHITTTISLLVIATILALFGTISCFLRRR